MATIKLQRSSNFSTAIYLGEDLGDALSDGHMLVQNVLIERMNGKTENVNSFIQVKGDFAHIGVIREETFQQMDQHIPVSTSPLDAEELILSLTLELLLS
jgi:hypothetical protein